MNALTYTQVRQNFSEVMNKVCDDHAPIIVTRQNSSPVVMISLEDYNAIEETLHLFRSSKNALRLHQSLKEYEENQLIQKELLNA